MTAFQILFSPHGRIRRRDYWLSTLGILFFSATVLFIAHKIWGTADTFVNEMKEARIHPLSPLGVLYMLNLTVMEWPRFCVMAKRWHDRAKSGWLAGALVLGNLICLVIAHFFLGGGSLHAQPLGYLLRLPVSILALWTIVECGCLDGDKGPNKYGQSPKSKTVQAEVF